jgi:hypothetical protein
MDRFQYVLVADTGNHCIRIVHPDNRVQTLAGGGASGTSSGQRDGLKLDARFNSPSAIAVGSEDEQTLMVYVADTGNGLVRKLHQDGYVETIAGCVDAMSHPVIDPLADISSIFALSSSSTPTSSSPSTPRVAGSDTPSSARTPSPSSQLFFASEPVLASSEVIAEDATPVAGARVKRADTILSFDDTGSRSGGSWGNWGHAPGMHPTSSVAETLSAPQSTQVRGEIDASTSDSTTLSPTLQQRGRRTPQSASTGSLSQLASTSMSTAALPPRAPTPRRSMPFRPAQLQLDAALAGAAAPLSPTLLTAKLETLPSGSTPPPLVLFFSPAFQTCVSWEGDVCRRNSPLHTNNFMFWSFKFEGDVCRRNSALHTNNFMFWSFKFVHMKHGRWVPWE